MTAVQGPPTPHFTLYIRLCETLYYLYNTKTPPHMEPKQKAGRGIEASRYYVAHKFCRRIGAVRFRKEIKHKLTHIFAWLGGLWLCLLLPCGVGLVVLDCLGVGVSSNGESRKRRPPFFGSPISLDRRARCLILIDVSLRVSVVRAVLFHWAGRSSK